MSATLRRFGVLCLLGAGSFASAQDTNFAGQLGIYSPGTGVNSSRLAVSLSGTAVVNGTPTALSSAAQLTANSGSASATYGGNLNLSFDFANNLLQFNPASLGAVANLYVNTSNVPQNLAPGLLGVATPTAPANYSVFLRALVIVTSANLALRDFVFDVTSNSLPLTQITPTSWTFPVNNNNQSSPLRKVTWTTKV